MITLSKLNVEDRLAMFNNVSEEHLERLRDNLNENQRLLNVAENDSRVAKEEFEALKKDYEVNTTDCKALINIFTDEANGKSSDE
jgi:hypothetical protein